MTRTPETSTTRAGGAGARRGATTLAPVLALTLFLLALQVGRDLEPGAPGNPGGSVAPAPAGSPVPTGEDDVASSTGWQQVLPGLALAFPRDHGAHPRTRTEWWYLTGQVVAEDGRRFGLQVTVFRRGLGDGPLAVDAASPLLVEGAAELPASPLRSGQVLLGHLALTDVATGRTRFAERLRRPGAGLARASEADLDVRLEDWTIAREDLAPAAGAGVLQALAADGVALPVTADAPAFAPTERVLVRASDSAAGFGLTLELVPAKPLVGHGDAGYSAKGGATGNASAYTSWTRLATRGTLTLDGEELAVAGASWFDHEFGSSVLAEGVTGWDWFGLHLDDGRELMAFDLRTAAGGRHAASAGTLVAPDGTPRSLTAAAFTITPRGTWTSPHTGGVYPAGWTLALPDEDLVLVALPLVADCELVTDGSTGVAYWEGPVELFAPGPDGEPTGPAVGRGYAELTGYAGAMTGRL